MRVASGLIFIAIMMPTNSITEDAISQKKTSEGVLCQHVRSVRRIITYNVLYGGDGCGEKRLERLQNWIRFGSQDADAASCPTQARYDFAAFNECNGWQRDFAGIADGFGFPYSVLLEAKTGFHIAFMSRYPFQAVKHVGPPFHHGMLEVRDDQHGLAFLLTHLTPRSAAQRALEAAAVARRVAASGP